MKKQKLFNTTLLLVLMVVLTILTGCTSATNPVSERDSFTEAKFLPIDSNKDINGARVLAEIRLTEIVKENDPCWDDETAITTQYPIYTPGIEEPSHYEFKVQNNDAAAGYILVSMTEADIEIPEVATDGPTLTEEYRSATGVEDIKVFRFDFFTSAAEADTSGTRSGEPVLLATMGMYSQGIALANETRGETTVSELYAGEKSIFTDKVIENGCLPMYNKEGLSNYYSDLAEINDATRRGTIPTVVSRKATLNPDNRFYNYSTEEYWQTPGWEQPDFGEDHPKDGYPMGCGPTAWSIAYAYWAQFKGKVNLFYFEDRQYIPSNSDYGTNDFVKNTVSKLHDYMGTWSVDWPYKGSPTWPKSLAGSNRNMLDAWRYGNECGYDTSTSWNSIFWDWTGGTDFVWNEITNDRPVVLYFDAGMHTSSSDYELFYWHYGVVEGVKTHKWSNTGWATELAMLVNFGWGDKRKWIYAFSDVFMEQITACYEVYSLNIGPRTDFGPLLFHSKLESDASWTTPDVCDPDLTPSCISSENMGPFPVANYYVPGRFGNANLFEMNFPTTSGTAPERSLYITDTPAMLPTRGTMEFWTKVGRETPDADTRINLEIPGLDMELAQIDDDLICFINTGTPDQRQILLGPVLDDEWQYVYINWDRNRGLVGGNTFCIWINGVIVAQLSSNIPVDAGIWKFVISTLRLRAGYSKVCLDNVKIYKDVVSQNTSEIEGFYLDPAE